MKNEHMDIHVDYNPDHSQMSFDDTNGEPILFHRGSPDGWVLLTRDADEFATGITSLADVDRAILAARAVLGRG